MIIADRRVLDPSNYAVSFYVSVRNDHSEGYRPFARSLVVYIVVTSSRARNYFQAFRTSGIGIDMGYKSDISDRRESFLNVRVRLQRLVDAKFFAGWVRTLSDSEIVIDFSKPEEFQIGSKFFVTINGVHSAAVVQATLENQSSGFLTLRFDSTLRYLNTTEAVRRQVTGLSGVVKMEGAEIEIQISDVAVNGFGATIEGSLTRGDIVELEIDTPYGSVSGKAEIRYCRQDTKDSLKHRIGFQFVQLGRIETARWNRLTDDSAA